MKLLDDLSRSLRDWGPTDTFERVLCKVATIVMRRGFRKTGAPLLLNLFEAAQVMSDDPAFIARELFSLQNGQIAQLREEFDELQLEISRRYADRALDYPPSWALGENSTFLLYAIVRTTKPATVLETGVANGHSSFFILNALRRNANAGKLHSVDIASNVGNLVDAAERAAWDLRLLSASASKDDFLAVLRSLPRLDVMVHDSDHTYRWLNFELEAVLQRMSTSALIICDDTDMSFAMLDFCRRHALKPSFLVDTHKVLGLVPLGRSA